MELKINSIERHLKLIIEKLPITNFEEKENVVDIFQDLPLQNKNDLDVIEAKLINDKSYRSQMVSPYYYFDLFLNKKNIFEKK